jgi:hypothetical protein
MIRAHAAELGATLQTGLTFASLPNEPDGVRVELTDGTSEMRGVRGDLRSADGTHLTVSQLRPIRLRDARRVLA